MRPARCACGRGAKGRLFRSHGGARREQLFTVAATRPWRLPVRPSLTGGHTLGGNTWVATFRTAAHRVVDSQDVRHPAVQQAAAVAAAAVATWPASGAAAAVNHGAAAAVAAAGLAGQESDLRHRGCTKTAAADGRAVWFRGMHASGLQAPPFLCLLPFQAPRAPPLTVGGGDVAAHGGQRLQQATQEALQARGGGVGGGGERSIASRHDWGREGRSRAGPVGASAGACRQGAQARQPASLPVMACQSWPGPRWPHLFPPCDTDTP